MTSRRTKRQSGSGIRLPLWGVALLALIGAAFLLGSSFWLFNAVRRLASDWNVTETDPDIITDPSGQTSQDLQNQVSDSSEENQPIISLDAFQPWSGRDRVSILLLGIDQRCDEEGPTRTDTMMVLTVDPVGLSAAVLSLPRDLWVEIPGFQVDKINRAHFLGEAYNYPGGGPALAVETVEAALGINIDFYAAVNFDAFIEVVDLIDGLDVVVTEDIADDDYPDNCYGYDPFYIAAGEHHLDGQTALKYARTRATFGGDVDRAARQQQVILAVRNKVLQLNMVPQLIADAPKYWRILQDNVRTDLSLNEAIQLGLLVQQIPGDSIRTEVLDYDYVYNAVTPDGQAVLVPVRDQIRALRDQLFAPPAIPTPVVENLPTMMREEAARVAVYNGTPVFGLAAETESYLLAQGLIVVEIGNADSAEYRTTQIIDYGSHPNTTHYLIQLMGIPPLNTSTGTSPNGDYDVLVILGSDWKVPGSE